MFTAYSLPVHAVTERKNSLGKEFRAAWLLRTIGSYYLDDYLIIYISKNEVDIKVLLDLVSRSRLSYIPPVAHHIYTLSVTNNQHRIVPADVLKLWTYSACGYL